MKPANRIVWSASLIAIAMSGCGGGGGGGYGGETTPPPAASPPPPAATPPPASTGFTSYSKQMHAAGEHELPWDLDTVTFAFDGDQDPAAYDDLLPPAE